MNFVNLNYSLLPCIYIISVRDAFNNVIKSLIVLLKCGSLINMSILVFFFLAKTKPLNPKACFFLNK